MLTQLESRQLRADLFLYLDGLVTAPVAFALYEKDITNYILNKGSVDISELSVEFIANEGYLNASLRIMASQGWLNQDVNNRLNKVIYSINERTEHAFKHFALYADVVALQKLSGNYHARKFAPEAFQVMEGIFKKFESNFGLVFSENELEREVQNQILKHIEGVLIAPSTVLLGMGGMFHKYFMEASFMPEEYHEHAESFRKLLDFYTFLGWFKARNNTYQFTDKGLFFARRASAFGVTVSYLPMFRKADELIFGNPETLRDPSDNGPEQHVDREMNVWGSGGAHSTYFNRIDEVVIEMFNKPIEEQPKGILDMGCGNGAFLEHLFDVIEQRTLRGKMLDEHPLFMVGADYNQAALKITRANLIKADIWAKIVWGDIGRPDLLDRDLREDYNIELSSLLNLRTFLDHNRIWQEPELQDAERLSTSTGAFCCRGRRLSNNVVEDNLLEHFKKWSPYVKKFGLLVIELHTIKPSITASNLGKTPATAYDATHAFSDQYIVEAEVFLRIAAKAGLNPDPKVSTFYPDVEMATVTVNLLKG